MHIWQIQEAKARFSEVVRQAEQEGPQDITWHGRSVAVLLSRSDYERLTGTNQSLVDFMQHSPLLGLDELDFSRDQSLTREVSL